MGKCKRGCKRECDCDCDRGHDRDRDAEKECRSLVRCLSIWAQRERFPRRLTLTGTPTQGIQVGGITAVTISNLPIAIGIDLSPGNYYVLSVNVTLPTQKLVGGFITTNTNNTIPLSAYNYTTSISSSLQPSISIYGDLIQNVALVNLGLIVSSPPTENSYILSVKTMTLYLDTGITS